MDAPPETSPIYDADDSLPDIIEEPAQAPEVTEPEKEKVDGTTSATQENEEMINEQMSK